MRRDPEAMKRAAARKQKEDDAARLREKVPNLKRLALHIEEHPMGPEGPPVRHIRHVVVERAPALFEIPCSERACRGGGHDLTRRVMKALRSGKQAFAGKHRCAGEIDGEACLVEICFEAEATFA
jgi:hypothetical protein